MRAFSRGLDPRARRRQHARRRAAPVERHVAAPACDGGGGPIGETNDPLYVLSTAVWAPAQLPIPVCWEEAGDAATKQLIRQANDIRGLRRFYDDRAHPDGGH